VEDGGRVETRVVPYVVTATAVGHDGRDPVCFQKFVIFFNSDGGKLYMKIVALDEIYNFAV
jgi:hypothetical protein